MRIAIKAHGLRVAGGLSVGLNIIDAMGRVAPEHTYFCTVPSGLGYEDICQRIPNCRVYGYRHTGGLLRRFIFEGWKLPRLVREFRPDVIFALGSTGLINTSFPQAVLVQNAHRLYSAHHAGPIGLRQRIMRRLRDWRFRRALTYAHMVFCQTNAMISRLRKVCGYRGPVELCPKAVSIDIIEESSPSPPSSLAPFTDKFRLFCLTKYYAHKNLEGLVETFCRFRHELQDCIVLLTISPQQGRKARRLLARIEQEGLQDMVVNVGPLPQSELGAYYQHCDALILPTFLESFSGTYLEAMRFGCPILTSDLEFAHEICVDSAIYFDPWNVSSMKDAVLRLKNNPDIGRRLVRLGREQLQKFPTSWDDIARHVLRHLDSLAKGASY